MAEAQMESSPKLEVRAPFLPVGAATVNDETHKQTSQSQTLTETVMVKRITRERRR